MKIVIIHGTFGTPEENRFPWVKHELKKLGHEVYVPKLPTPENQTPQSRCNELQRQVPFVFDQDTVLIGHSLWATYLLHILDRERTEAVKKTILVSWFAHLLGNETFDTINAPFLSDTFDRARIQQNAWVIHIFHGDNDPYVPMTEAEYLHKQLWGELHSIPQWGHLNASAGFTTFEEIVEEIIH